MARKKDNRKRWETAEDSNPEPDHPFWLWLIIVSLVALGVLCSVVIIRW